VTTLDWTLGHDSDFGETTAPPTPTSWQPLPFVLESSFSIRSSPMKLLIGRTWHPRQSQFREKRELGDRPVRADQLIYAEHPRYRPAVSLENLLPT
jgi:hypothetical protein